MIARLQRRRGWEGWRFESRHLPWPDDVTEEQKQEWLVTFEQMNREANWFAVAFLMPEKEYRKSYEDNDGVYVLIARDFKVTEAHARLRAVSLGLEEI